jgi:hypothetical protein
VIISDTHKFIFIHIPKCGGTTVRNALLSYDEHRSDFFDKGIEDHPELGRIDYHHLPLEALALMYPAEYELLDSYRSFALVREPVQRFCSGISYRIKIMGWTGDGENQIDMFKQEARRVLAFLQNRRGSGLLPSAFAHFARQAEFINHGDMRKISDVRRIENLAALLTDISEIIGHPLKVRESNQSLRFRNEKMGQWNARLQPILKRALPRSVWKPILVLTKSVLEGLGQVQVQNTALLADCLSMSELQQIHELYEEDMQIYSDAS